MGDIDVLVRKTDFRRAHEILVENGYVKVSISTGRGKP